MVTFTRDELDIAWNSKDKFQEDFKIEVYFKFNSFNTFSVQNSCFGVIKHAFFFPFLYMQVFFSDIEVSEPETPTKETIKDDSHEIQSIATEGTQYDEFFDTEETVKEPKPILNYPFRTPAEEDAITESDIHVVESSSNHEPDVKLELNLTNGMRIEMSDIHVVGNRSVGEGEREKSREIKRPTQKSILSSKMPLPIRGTKKNSATPKNLKKPNLNVESKVAKIIHGGRNLTQSMSSPRASMQRTELSPVSSPRTPSNRRSSLDGSVPSFVTPINPQLPRVKIRVTDARQQKPAQSISSNLALASPKASTLATTLRATSPRLSHTVSLQNKRDVTRDLSVLSRSFSNLSTRGYRTPPHPSQLRNAVMSPRKVSRSGDGAGSASTRITQKKEDGIRRTASMPRSTSVPKTRARAV